MTLFLMEITEEMPVAYERFAMRRLFWQESGQRWDDLTRQEVVEAMTFRALEKQHPHRFNKRDEKRSV